MIFQSPSLAKNTHSRLVAKKVDYATRSHVDQSPNSKYLDTEQEFPEKHHAANEAKGIILRYMSRKFGRYYCTTFLASEGFSKDSSDNYIFRMVSMDLINLAKVLA